MSIRTRIFGTATVFALAAGVGACSDTTAPILPGPGNVQSTVTLDGVTFRAATTLLSDGEVMVTFEAQNVTSEAQATGILGGNCMIRLRAYTDEARSGEPVFGPPLDEACQEPLRFYELEPGEADVTEQFFTMAGPTDVMYFFTVEFQHSERYELAAGMGLLSR
jgi:hypothetical protein